MLTGGTDYKPMTLSRRACYVAHAMSSSIAILSAAVTVFALALSVFGTSWLNQRNTEMFVEQLGQRIDQRIDSLEKRFDQRLDSMDQRIGRIERQLEAIFKPSLPK